MASSECSKAASLTTDVRLKKTITAKSTYMITVIWDTWLKPGSEVEGLRLTRQVWRDMKSFDGYISHEIYIDQDSPLHIIALATWQTRAHADSVREKYKDSPVIRELTPLLARPRDRWITFRDQAGQDAVAEPGMGH